MFAEANSPEYRDYTYDSGDDLMLFTEIYEKQDTVPSIGGIHPDTLLDPIRGLMKEAQYFVFDEQAVAMAANVAQSKPSSIIACLPFVKLPAPLLWIEFSNQHLRQAMGTLGSPNVRGERHTVDIERTGFLLREQDGQIVMDHVHRDRLPGGGTTITVSNVRLAFDPDVVSRRHEFAASMSHLMDKLAPDDESPPDDIEPLISGKIAKRAKQVENNDAEAIATKQLSWRFGMIPNPDHAHLRQAMLSVISERQLTLMEADQTNDAFRIFVNLILPGLILLNCRNAVRTEIVPPADKLNKQRAKKGRPPIEGYQYVRLHLTPKKKRLYERHGISTNSTTGGVVIGHFKVRDSGIFWWNPHWRGSEGDIGRRKIYVMTP
jgi:hypothetical protein